MISQLCIRMMMRRDLRGLIAPRVVGLAGLLNDVTDLWRRGFAPSLFVSGEALALTSEYREDYFRRVTLLTFLGLLWIKVGKILL